MASLLPVWANTTTPFYAGVKCGNITQTTTFNTTGSAPVDIGFTDPATWSDTQSFTSDYGFTWVCQISGVYNLRFNQTYTVENQYVPPDSAISVIPNTTFYFDISGTLVAPQGGGSLILHPVGDQATVASTQDNIISDVFMAKFVSPANFLTNTVIPGGTWTLSMFGVTDDITEANNFYIVVDTVDADGVSNPIVVYDGSVNTVTMTASGVPYNYNSLQIIPTFTVVDLTKRIQIILYANFGVPSTITFYFRNETPSNTTTTVTQDVVPLTQDTVNARITVDALTSEFNQVFASSMPINIANGETLTYSSSVNAIANVYRGDTVTCSLVSDQGRVLVTSGQTTLPSPPNTFQWNLIAEGAYGNATIIAAPGPMMFSAPVVTVEATPDPIITSTTEISQVVLDLRNAI